MITGTEVRQLHITNVTKKLRTIDPAQPSVFIMEVVKRLDFVASSLIGRFWRIKLMRPIFPDQHTRDKVTDARPPLERTTPSSVSHRRPPPPATASNVVRRFNIVLTVVGLISFG